MKALLLVPIILILTGCMASTKLTGITDPSYRQNFTAKTILVSGAGMTLEEKKALEETYLQAFQNYDVNLLRGLDVFPPTRDFSNADMIKMAKNSGADTILLVDASARDISESYVPPTYHPGTTTSYVTGYGQYAQVHTNSTPGYTTGGYSTSSPLMAVTVTLFDTKKRRTVWTADGSSIGNKFSSFTDLINSVARSSVTELSNEGLIVPFMPETEKTSEASNLGG